MSAGREQILGRIRGSLGRGALPEAAQEALRARIADHPRGTEPARNALDAAGLVDLFVEKAEAVQATVRRVADLDGVPDVVAEYLAGENLPAEFKASLDPDLNDIPWDRRPTLSVTRGGATPKDEVGLTGAFAGVAETGTLAMRSGPEHPAGMNFLPDTHIAVLRASRIVGPYEDALARMRDDMPRTVNFITGPSRTGDIDQTIYLGAHGPRRLLIVLVEDT